MVVEGEVTRRRECLRRTGADRIVIGEWNEDTDFILAIQEKSASMEDMNQSVLCTISTFPLSYIKVHL
jgi:hypothetical protein